MKLLEYRLKYSIFLDIHFHFIDFLNYKHETKVTNLNCHPRRPRIRVNSLGYKKQNKGRK